MTNENIGKDQEVDKDIAQAWQDLNEGEKAAEQLEKMLDKFEAKVDAILSSDDVKDLEKMQSDIEQKMNASEKYHSADDKKE